MAQLQQQCSEAIGKRFDKLPPRLARATGYVWPEWKPYETDAEVEREKLNLIKEIDDKIVFEISSYLLPPRKGDLGSPSKPTDKIPADFQFWIGVVMTLIFAGLGYIGISVNVWLGLILLLAAFTIASYYLFWRWSKISDWSNQKRMVAIGLAFIVWCGLLARHVIEGYSTKDVEQEVSDLLRHGSDQQSTIELIFKESPHFTPERREFIRGAIESFNRYLSDVGFVLPVDTPPIGIMLRGAGGMISSMAPGDALEEVIWIGATYLDDRRSIIRAYSEYFFNETLHPIMYPDFPRRYPGESGFERFYVKEVYADYFTDSFLGDTILAGSDKGPPWPRALWNIRERLGQKVADMILFYGYKRFLARPKELMPTPTDDQGTLRLLVRLGATTLNDETDDLVMNTVTDALGRYNLN